MKQKLLAILILATIGFSSFTVDKPAKATENPSIINFWWDFNGSLINQNDPYYYSKDGDNWPDCPNVTGTTRCEIRADGSSIDDNVPELSSISGIRYRPL